MAEAVSRTMCASEGEAEAEKWEPVEELSASALLVQVMDELDFEWPYQG